MSGSQPFFSIITATRDAGAHLPGLLDSLARQSFTDFEHIIQDGGSSDNTLEIASNATWPVSLETGTDHGIYDAWNKALPRINGQWILFLGADDRLAASDTLEKAFALLKDAPLACHFAAGGQVYGDDPEAPLSTLYCRAAHVPATIAEAMVPHSATFHRAELFGHDSFSTMYRFLGDWDFIWRNWTSPAMGMDLPFPVTLMSRGGVTSDIRNIIPLRREHCRLLSEHGHRLGPSRWLAFWVKTSLIRACSIVMGPERAAGLLNTWRVSRGKIPIWA